MMAGSIARWKDKSADCSRKFLVELIALWFALKHPRAPWYAKIIMLAPLGYLLSPFDLVPNALALFGIGQFDDFLVVRYSYLLLKKVVKEDVLVECREQAVAHLAEQENRKCRIVIGLAIAWLLILMLLIWDIYKRLHRRSIL